MPNRHTLIPGNIIKLLKTDSLLTYSRDVALSEDSSKLLRIGESFIDNMERYIHWDDRGKTFAFWRIQPNWSPEEGAEWIGFRFVYIIEADDKPFKELSKNKKIDYYEYRACHRRTDAFFPPQFKIINIDIDMRFVKDPEVLSIIEKPFMKIAEGGNDINLHKQKSNIIDRLIDSSAWPDVCKEARKRSQQMIEESTEYRGKCEELARQAENSLNEKMSKLQLRFGKGCSEISIKKDLETEKVIGEAMIESIRNPLIRLDSVGFIVISGRNILEE